jgi:hypothetical protein
VFILIGNVILIGGILAALWKLDIPARIGMSWTLIGLAISTGIGIMLAVFHGGKKETI